MASAIEPAGLLLAGSADPKLKAYLTVRRRFDYAGLIVALYASFEHFVEDILMSYVRTITKRGNYDDLPAGLIRKHLRKTGELLIKEEIDQIRYPGVTSRQLIENLFRCLSGSAPYELNHMAVTAHERNIWYNELGVLLRLVELSHDAVCQAKPLIDWYYEEQKMTGARPTSVPTIVVQQRLDDVVERRNDVAHRGGNPANRLGIAEMRDRVEFILALARSIFTLFVSRYLEKLYVGAAGCERLALTEGPFGKGHVWVVGRPSIRLRVSQPTFALSPHFLVRWGRVRSLQVNGVDHTSVDPVGTEPVGVRLDFSAPRNGRLYVLDAEDDVIWPALTE